MTVAVPNTFATQSGNVPASQLDSNWSTLTNYYNARETTTGTLAARPSAGTTPRFYVATDTAGGTLYFDTGTGWIQVASGVTGNSPGLYGVRNLTGATATNTTIAFAADAIQLRNPTDTSTVVRVNTGSLTNDISTAGSTANGRDQAGAFSTSIFLHFYMIWNGTTLATLSSQTAPPTGPTLPSGYTHWAYCTAVWNAAGPILRPVHVRGAWTYHQTAQNALSDGRATVETSVSLANFIPANALSTRINFGGLINNGTTTLKIRTVTGADYDSIINTGAPSAVNLIWRDPQILPNVSQQFFYLWGADPTANYGLNAPVQGYSVGNGGE